jgi:hypothetical protein
LQALDRAEALLQHATPDMLSARLHPDMFDCARQFAAAAGFALRATFPLAGQDVPDGDFGHDAADLQARIADARARIATLTPADFTDAATRRIVHRAGFAALDQSGADYLHHFALPNMWFHLSMAFAILRQQGAPIGKAAFDGLHSYPDGFSFPD